MKKIILFTFLISIYLVANSQNDIIPSVSLQFPTLPKVEYISTPCISFDGNYLIFTAIVKDNYYFYECKRIGDKWSEPVELTDITKNITAEKYKNAPVYNYDASIIYFEALNGFSNDIFSSKRTPTGWTDPYPLSETINSSLNEGEPAVSADDNSLYFVRFLDPKNEDCGTLFRSVKNYKNEWDSAFVLIQPVTLGCDRSPRVMVDNKTILFSSKRELQKDFEIYYTKNLLFNDSWFLPQIVGKFSNNQDLYPTSDYTGTTMFFSSLRNKRNASIDYAILPPQYQPEPTTKIIGKITDSANNPIPVNIVVRNPISLFPYSTYTNNPQTGDYTIFVPCKSNYILDFSAPNYSHLIYNYTNKHVKSAIDTINGRVFKDVNIYLKIFDKEIFEPMQVAITIEDSTKTKVELPITNIRKGYYSFSLPIGENYEITVKNEFAEPYNFQVNLSNAIIYPKIEKNVELTAIKTPIYIKIADVSTNQPVVCDITITNTSTQQKVEYNATTDKDGNVVIYGRKGDTYNIAISPKGYAFYSTDITIGDEQKQDIVAKIQPLTLDATIELKNINFETNSAELKQASLKELDKVVDLLKINTNIKIEISAHTDDKGAEAYNLILSERRAKSVVEYLLQKGIAPENMTYKGYGKSKPLVPNTSEANRAINRRVEIKILEVTN